jgi:hypothetical protein
MSDRARRAAAALAAFLRGFLGLEALPRDPAAARAALDRRAARRRSCC